jgi:uncharacterized protein (DUF1330 family)
MAGYLIVRVNVTDPERYGEYMKRTPAVIASYGGEFVVRGGAIETLEGDEETRRVAVIRFPSVEQAKACTASAEYLEAKAFRVGAAEMQAIVVEGT